MNDQEVVERIAEELYAIWQEAKYLDEFDDWSDQDFYSLPEKHKHEYYLTANRIIAIAREGYVHLPEGFPIVEGFGGYEGDGEDISHEAQKLADRIAIETLRKTLERTKDNKGHQILTRHTISLLCRDFEFAARIEAMSKLAQRDADLKYEKTALTDGQ